MDDDVAPPTLVSQRSDCADRELGWQYEEELEEPTSPLRVDDELLGYWHYRYAEPVPPGWFTWRKFWLFCGPGFLMSIAFVDPGNLESDLQAGATSGTRLLWVLLWSTYLGLFIQVLSARLGIGTTKHLAEHCRAEYARPVSIFLWIVTEMAIIGSDIQEVIGSSIAIEVLTNGKVPLSIGVIISALAAFVFLFIERLGVRKLEAFFGMLISIMCLCFGYMYFRVGVDQVQVIKGLLVPHVEKKLMTQTLAIVGAIIMPHNLFLHSALVRSRTTVHGVTTREASRYFALEAAIALTASLCINVFVVSVFAKGFFGKSIKDLGLQNAGNYLGHHFGTTMKYVWGVGLLAAGQSSTMTGTYSGQFVMQGFLDLHVKPWQRILITRSISLVPTLLVAFLFSNSSYLDTLSQCINVEQSLILPFILITLLRFTSSGRIMKGLVNSTWMIILGGSGSILIGGINFYFLLIGGGAVLPSAMLPHYGILLVGCALYFGMLGYILFVPSAKDGRGRHARTPLLDEAVE